MLKEIARKALKVLSFITGAQAAIMLTFFIVALPKRTADVIQWEFAVFFLLVLLQSVYIILQRKPKVYGIEWPPPLKDELVDAEFAR